MYTDTRADRREWTALAVLLLPLLLVSMDVSVLYFAAPFIAHDLHPSATQQLWIFDVYGFVLAALLLTMGAVGDRIGRKRLLLIGAAGFGAASLAAAYAQDAGQLIAARAVLGVAGATLMPSTLGLIRTMFTDERQRGKAISIWTAVMSGGVALGPVLSGVLVEHYWWGSVFLVNLPAMALLLVLGPVLLPEHRSPTAQIDLAGAALSLLAVLGGVYGLKRWAAGDLDEVALVSLGGAVVFGAAFAVRQRTAATPLLDRALLRRPGFASGALRNVIAMFALVGNAVFVTQYLQSVLGLSPLVAALWSIAPSVLVAAAAPAATALGSRFGRDRVIAGGFALGAAGFAVLATVPDSDGLLTALTGASLLAVGIVGVLTVVTELAMIAIEPARAGTATAVLETGSELGGALGIALLGSIGAAVYRHEAPAGAGRTLGAVTSPDLLAPARAAFVSGYHVAALVGAAVLLLAALVSATCSR